jgi:hypothetical protein
MMSVIIKISGNMDTTISPTVFVLTDWKAAKRSNTGSQVFMVDTPGSLLKKRKVHIGHGIQQLERSFWETAQIDSSSCFSECVSTKQLILVFDGSDPWSGRIEVSDRFGRIEFNQIVNNVVDIEILENWLSTGKCMSHEEAKHFPNLEQELQVIREQIIALKEDKVELPGTVNYLPGHMKYILGSRYNFSDEEQEKIVSNMYTFRRTSSQIEKMGSIPIMRVEYLHC